MRLWKRVRIGSLTWPIRLVTEKEMPDAEGETDFDRHEIRLRSDLVPERFQAALFHELIHASLEQGASSTLEHVAGTAWTASAEEMFVRSLEGPLLVALKDLGWRPRRK
jgi:hypothetical protein